MWGRAMWITNAPCHTLWMDAWHPWHRPGPVGSHVTRIKTRIGSCAAMEQAASRVENPRFPCAVPLSIDAGCLAFHDREWVALN